MQLIKEFFTCTHEHVLYHLFARVSNEVYDQVHIDQSVYNFVGGQSRRFYYRDEYISTKQKRCSTEPATLKTREQRENAHGEHNTCLRFVGIKLHGTCQSFRSSDFREDFQSFFCMIKRFAFVSKVVRYGQPNA